MFSPVWEFDEEAGLWCAALPEIEIHTDAPTKEEAAEQLVELVMDYCEDYFTRPEFFTALPDRRAHYPYLRRVAGCRDAAQVREVLGL
jgi:hypothetical protein